MVVNGRVLKPLSDEERHRDNVTNHVPEESLALNLKVAHIPSFVAWMVGREDNSSVVEETVVVRYVSDVHFGQVPKVMVAYYFRKPDIHLGNVQVPPNKEVFINPRFAGKTSREILGYGRPRDEADRIGKKRIHHFAVVHLGFGVKWGVGVRGQGSQGSGNWKLGPDFQADHLPESRNSAVGSAATGVVAGVAIHDELRLLKSLEHVKFYSVVDDGGGGGGGGGGGIGVVNIVSYKVLGETLVRGAIICQLEHNLAI